MRIGIPGKLCICNAFIEIAQRLPAVADVDVRLGKSKGRFWS